MEIAQQKEREGKIDEANDYFYRALEISPDLYPPLIAQLKERHIQFIVSPYESDAQLGFLFRNNYIDLVISEDGDTLVYGCRRVLFKLDKGVGEEIDMSRLSRCTKLNFCDWTHDMFTYLCVLSGCDYLPSLRGVGIVRAYQAVSRGRTPAGIFAALREARSIPAEYESGFARAVFTFRHQTVFDPQRRAAVPLLPLPAALQSAPPDYLGPVLPPLLAQRVAAGEAHPVTHRPVGTAGQAMGANGSMGSNGSMGTMGSVGLNGSVGSMGAVGSNGSFGTMDTVGLNGTISTMDTAGSMGLNGSMGSASGSMEEEPGEPRFSSPFVSVSFRALIERPSERGLPPRGDLSHLDFASGSAVKRAMVLESPPRKRPAVQQIGPSPVAAKCVNAFLDQFRRSLSQH